MLLAEANQAIGAARLVADEVLVKDGNLEKQLELKLRKLFAKACRAAVRTPQSMPLTNPESPAAGSRGISQTLGAATGGERAPGL